MSLKNYQENLKQQDYEIFHTILDFFLPYLQVKGVNEIIINKEQEVFVVQGTERTCVEDNNLTDEVLDTFCRLLAQRRNLLFNELSPHLATSIPNTRYRVNALHPSITATNDISVCIRVPNDTRFDLSAFKLSPNCKYGYDDLKHFMKIGKNILVSGGTGSGKTSLINSLLSEIPINERIISVEDSEELNLERFENKVQIIVGKNENAFFTYENALNSAMRMSPDRLLMGDLNTRNTLLFLRLGNAGYKGLVSTIHANNIESILEAMALNIKIGSEKDLLLNDVAVLLKKSTYVLMQIEKDRKTGERIIQEIALTQEVY